MRPTIKPEYGLFIDGTWRSAEGGATLETTNPATGEVLARIADASKKDVDDAVAAARRAFATFGQTTTEERAALLMRIADLIEANQDELAAIETMDNGKPIRETSIIDIPYSVDHFRYFAAAIRADEGQASVLEGNKLSVVLREPIGVVGQIVPWNFPFLMAAWKLAPVIAAGDCTVFKPSSTTSLSVLRLAELLDGVLPPGVFNLVTGRGSKCGEHLRLHPDLDKLAFTGSTAVGRDIALAAAERLIPATLELGGKSANIIFEDADFAQALDGVQLGILFNQGQVCCAGSRVFVQESVYDEFLAKLVERFKAIKVGDPMDPTTVMGAQINAQQVETIMKYVNIGLQEGAKIAAGGKPKTGGLFDRGSFMEPTLLVDVNNTMCVAQEEIFGPVAVVMKFKDENEVVQMANDSIYGLGGAVFTQNLTRALRVARAIRTGRMWVNTYNQIPSGAPFGGYKQSGIGRETHKALLNHYTQSKNIMIDLSGKPSGFYEKA